MPKGKVTFVVEGDLETTFLKAQCGNSSVVRKVPSNGDSVSIECLGKMISAIVCAGHQPSDLFVILDREGRVETAPQLEKALLADLNSRGITGNIYVHFADRMIENWIISDSNAMKKHQLTISVKTKETDGFGGKAKLKDAYRAIKGTYNERIDGPKLLGCCSAKTIAANSASFERLRTSMHASKIPCRWIHQ